MWRLGDKLNMDISLLFRFETPQRLESIWDVVDSSVWAHHKVADPQWPFRVKSKIFNEKKWLRIVFRVSVRVTSVRVTTLELVAKLLKLGEMVNGSVWSVTRWQIEQGYFSLDLRFPKGWRIFQMWWRAPHGPITKLLIPSDHFESNEKYLMKGSD